MTTTFTNSVDGAHAALGMTASYYSRHVDITAGDKVVAHLFRDFYTSKDLFKGKRTYYVSVAPGMDMALAVGITLYVHERVNEGNNGLGAAAIAAGAEGGAAAGAAVG